MWENNTSAKWYREWQNGLNPINGLQACIYKDFACIHKNLEILQIFGTSQKDL